MHVCVCVHVCACVCACVCGVKCVVSLALELSSMRSLFVVTLQKYFYLLENARQVPRWFRTEHHSDIIC